MKPLSKKILSLVLAFMMMFSVVSAPSAYAAIKYPVGDTSDYKVVATFVGADGTTEITEAERGETVYLKLELKDFLTLNSGIVTAYLNGAVFEEETDMLTDSVFKKDSDLSLFASGSSQVTYGISTDVTNLTNENHSVKYYAFDKATDLCLAYYRLSIDEDATEVDVSVTQNLKLGDANGVTGNIPASADGIIITGDTLYIQDGVYTYANPKATMTDYTFEDGIPVPELIPERLTVTADRYKDGEFDKRVEVSQDDYDIAIGTESFEIIFKNEFAELSSIKVKCQEPITPVGIRIIQKPYKTEYYVGDKLEPAGLRVVVVYSDGSTKELSSDDYGVSGLDSSNLGVITVTYMGFSTTFNVTIKSNILGQGTCGTNLTWILYDTGILTVSGEGAMASYSDATTVPWYSYLSFIKTIIVEEGVTTLGTNSFRDCPSLQSVSLPSTLTFVGYSSFRNDVALKSIVIPDKVDTIHTYAFYGCSALESIVLPASLTKIQEFTFYSCKKLNNVIIPENVISIGSNAFRGCTALTSIEIPYNVTEIGGGAFSYCTKLDTIKLYNKVTSIGGSAFLKSTAIKNVYFVGSEAEWQAINIGTSNETFTAVIVVFEKDDYLTWGKCGKDIEYHLSKDGVLTISGNGDMTSYSSASAVPWQAYADSITSVVVEEGITSIGNWAFYLLKKVTRVALPEGLITIGSNVFRGCSSLKEIVIPTTVTTIGSAAISYCSNLTKVTMYNNVKTIGGSAFVNCSKLKDVYYNGTKNEWLTISIGTSNDYLINANIHTVEKVTAISISTQPSKLIYEVGEGIDLTGLVVMGDYTDGVKREITDYTVTGFDSSMPGIKVVIVTYEDFSTEFTVEIKEPVVLTGITVKELPSKTIYEIGEELDLTGMAVFAQYSDATSAEITDYAVSAVDMTTSGIKTVTVSYGGFEFTFNITVNEPVVLTGIRNTSDRLKITYYTGESFDYDSIELMADYSDGTSEPVDDYTVSGFDTETIGIKAITIEYNGFTISYTITVIEKTIIAEGYCGENITWQLNKNGVLTLSGTGDMLSYTAGTAVPWYEYRDRITSVVVSDGITSLGSHAFYYCSYITNVSLPNGLITIGDWAFFACYELTGISIPDSVITIGEYAFDSCQKITALVLPASLTTIGRFAFNHNDSLEIITIPSGVSIIPSNCFAYCKNLKTVYIPKSVTLIGGYAFKNCTSLTDVYYDGTEAEWTLISNNSTEINSVNKHFIEVIAVMKGITVKTLPSKISYELYEAFDATGMVIVADYSDGKSVEITDYTVTGFDSDTPGTKIITVSYGEFTDFFEIYVNEIDVPSDSAVKYPVGDISGYEVSARFVDANGEDVESVNIGETMYMMLELKNFNTLNAGFVKVELEGATIVSERDMLTNSIFHKDADMSVTGVGDNKAIYGLSTDVSNLTSINQNVRYYDFKEPTDLYLALYEILPNATSTRVVANVSHNLKVGDAKGPLGNIPATAEGIILSGAMADVIYNEVTYGNQRVAISDNVFDHDPTVAELVARLIVTVDKYVNGIYTETLNVSLTDYTVEISGNVATIRFESPYAYLESIAVPFVVNEKPPVEISGIAIQKLPNKTVYNKGETLEITDMLVVANYSDGTSVAITDYVVAGYNPDMVGTQTIMVSYGTYTTSFQITVREITTNPTITIQSITANAGGTVDVAVSIENNPGILGMQLDFGFDSRLKLVDVLRAEGGALNSLDFTKPGAFDTTTPATILLEGLNADDSDGDFVVLRFEVPAYAVYGDEYHISVGYANGNIYDNDLNDIVCDIVNGKISISGFTLGDVNKDGTIDNADVDMLQKGIVGGYGVVLDQSADMNGDGMYTIKDITLLKRLIANMNTVSPVVPEAK